MIVSLSHEWYAEEAHLQITADGCYGITNVITVIVEKTGMCEQEHSKHRYPVDQHHVDNISHTADLCGVMMFSFPDSFCSCNL